jgi:hypothetical protein
MKKIFMAFITIIALNSCKTEKESCIERLVNEEGYTYDEACDECEQLKEDSEARYEKY